MGLLYPFPISEKEKGHVLVNGETIRLKSYGLPLYFWGYFGAFAVAVISMYFAISSPLAKLAKSEVILDKILAYGTYGAFLFCLVASLSLFYYQKLIIKNKCFLELRHKLMGLTIWKTKLELATPGDFTVKHYLDSPNVARLSGDQKMRGFQNQGYFELYAKLSNGASKRIDRHSLKNELEKISTLLKSY